MFFYYLEKIVFYLVSMMACIEKSLAKV